mgnify:FL=1
MKKAMPTGRQGFTLVELLVTLSIMAMIMGASLVAFNSSRAVARDGRRKADLEATRSALELYRSDVGAYPASLGLLSPNYISASLTDPNTPTRSYSYTPTCGTVCTSFTLCAGLELGGAVVSGCGSCGVTCNYKTTNP